MPNSVKQETKRFWDSENRPPALSGMRTDEGDDGGPLDLESTPDKFASCKKRLNFAGVKISSPSDDVFLSSDRDDDPEEMKGDSSYECTARRPPTRHATSKRQGPLKKREAKYLSKCDSSKEPQEGSNANKRSGRMLARDLREECDAFLEVDSEVSVDV